MSGKDSLGHQFHRNLLAVISLVVALSALGYNTWRNELTEENRNVRFAGFEMLLHLGELQRISYLSHYDSDVARANPRDGWVEVLVIRDMSMLISEPLAGSAEKLVDTWRENWVGLGTNDAAIAAIDVRINELRAEVLDQLKKLD